jgi:hypothetical protein
MPKKKGRPDKARKDTPLEELDQKETLVHYNSVIVEELRSNMQLVLECVQANSQRLSAIEQIVQGNSQRLSALEQAVKANSQRLDVVERAIHALKEDVLDMERRICSKINRIAERCDGFEGRIGA